MERISSRDNERVKFACRLAGSASMRTEQGLFFAEGHRLCLDMAQKLPCRYAFFTEKLLAECPEAAQLAEENFLVNEPVADKLAGTKTSQGLFCVFSLPKAGVDDIDIAKGVLVLEDIQDPANVGALLRSAAAFGFGGAVLAGACADPFAPKALRACMGAVARLPVVTGLTTKQAVTSLQEQKVCLYACALQNAKPLDTVALQKPYGLLIGNEGAGLSPQAIGSAEESVFIPMQAGVDSLNAAVAGSVMMFWFSRFV